MKTNSANYDKPAFLNVADKVFNVIAVAGFYIMLIAIAMALVCHVFFKDALLVYTLTAGITGAFLHIAINLAHSMMTSAFEASIETYIQKKETEKVKQEKLAQKANLRRTAKKAPEAPDEHLPVFEPSV